MKTFADWPFDCMKILNLHCVVTKSLGYEIFSTTISDITKYVISYSSLNTNSYCLLFWSPDCLDLLHFQTCKTWILPFGEVQLYAHPWDEGKNFCLLCLIAVSIIACILFFWGGGGGRGGSIRDGLSNRYENHSVRFSFSAGLILRNQQF